MSEVMTTLFIDRTFKQIAISRQMVGVYMFYFFLTLFIDRDLVFFSSSAPSIRSEWIMSTLYSGIFVFVFLFLGALASLVFSSLRWSRTSAFVIWVSFFILASQNRLIKEVQFDFIGLILLLFVFSPSSSTSNGLNKENLIYYFSRVRVFLFFLLALTLLVSGLSKWGFNIWRDGKALDFLVDSCFLRPQLSGSILYLPSWIKAAAGYAVVALEISVFFLFLFKRTQALSWLVCLMLQVGILIFLQLSQITVFYIIMLFFLFDVRWLEKKSFIY